MIELSKLLKELEHVEEYEKQKKVAEILEKDAFGIIGRKGSDSLETACLFKVKEGYHIIWSDENKIRSIQYCDLRALNVWNKMNRNGKPEHVDFVQKAIEELEEKYKIKMMLKM